MRMLKRGVAAACAAAAVLGPGAAPAQAGEVLSLQAQMVNGGWSVPGPGVRSAACLVDSGVDPGQLDVPKNLITAAVPGIAGTGPAASADGPMMHGTWMVQFVAAPQDGAGMVGPTPGVPLILIRAMRDGTGGFTGVDYQAGMNRCDRVAAQHGLRLAAIGLALGTDAASTEERRFVRDGAREAGVPVFAAVGNRQGAPKFPASEPGIIGVSALNATTGAQCVSNASPDSEARGLAAPGCIVTMPVGGAAQTVMSAGTSGATSLIAAATAQVCDLAPTLSPAECLEVLHETARPVTGGRVIDLRAAAARVGVSAPAAVVDAAPVVPKIPETQLPGASTGGVSLDGPTAGAVIPSWYALERAPRVRWLSRTRVKVSSPERGKKARIWTNLRGAKSGRYRAVSGRPALVGKGKKRRASRNVRITVRHKVGQAEFVRRWTVRLPKKPRRTSKPTLQL